MPLPRHILRQPGLAIAWLGVHLNPSGEVSPSPFVLPIRKAPPGRTTGASGLRVALDWPLTEISTPVPHTNPRKAVIARSRQGLRTIRVFMLYHGVALLLTKKVHAFENPPGNADHSSQ